MEIARQRQLSKTTIVEQENIFTQIYISANFHSTKIFPGIYMYICHNFHHTEIFPGIDMYICANFHPNPCKACEKSIYRDRDAKSQRWRGGGHTPFWQLLKRSQINLDIIIEVIEKVTI